MHEVLDDIDKCREVFDLAATGRTRLDALAGWEQRLVGRRRREEPGFQTRSMQVGSADSLTYERSKKITGRTT
jgi:hypothetical protein